MLEFYRIQDYPSAAFRKFYQRKDYLKFQDTIRTIAIYKSGGGLGDLVQSVPVFRSFREMFPKAEIIYLGLYQKPQCDTIFRNIPYIDRYIEYVRPGQGKSTKEYPDFFKKYFRAFDLIVDTQSKFIPSFYLWLLKPKYFLSKNPFFSYWRFLLNSKTKYHVVAKMLALARVLGFEGIDFNPVFEIPQENLLLAQRYLNNFSGPFIVILPGAGHPYKMWPKEKFVALADSFHSMGYQVILVAGEAEKELILEFARLMKNKPIIPLIDEPGFGKDPIYSIGLFKSCVLTVGCDCGGLHLATLAGCPVIGIYGPTDPVKSGPLGLKNAVIYKELPCSPCRMRGCKINRKCLQDIMPDEIVKVAKLMLNEATT